MKIRAGSDVLKAKSPVGIVLNAYADFRQTHFRLSIVKLEQINDMILEAQNKNNGEKLRGMPAYIAFDEMAQKFTLFPAADKAYDIGIYYHGPVQKM